MNGDATKKNAAVRPYEVGYGKPPVHARFQKGQSGNPRGGSRKVKLRRARGLAIKEAYRTITVREGDKTMRMPAIQAVMRSQVALAATGNGPAQRALLAAVNALEMEISVEFEEAAKGRAARPPLSKWEVARRIAAMLYEAIKERGVPPPGNLMDQIAFLTESREKETE
jgi:hypothetical protein